MENNYSIHCQCGSVQATLIGKPKVKGHCHCNDCRDLLNIPYHSVTAWKPQQLEITMGEKTLKTFQHPTLQMKRVYCAECGETIFNTNAMDWRVVSQHLIRKCNNNHLPEELAAESHFFYNRRIIDIDDKLPKHD